MLRKYSEFRYILVTTIFLQSDYPTNLLPFPKALFPTLATSGVANTTNAVGVQFLAAEKSNTRSLVKICPWKRKV